MQDWYVRLTDVIKVVAIFAALTLFFYFVIVWAADLLQQQDEVPKGRAVQVWQSEQERSLHSFGNMGERLLFFYWYGE